MDSEQGQFELTESVYLTLLVKHEPSLRAYARSSVPDWRAVDEHTYQSLNLELDFKTIADAHARIRELSRQRSNKIGRHE
jgi:hypothetical protein